MSTFSTRKTADKKPFRRDIQALRAFAVVAVVLYHLWPERLIGGFTGVDIFFVISGYLMTTSIMGRLNPLAQSRTVNVKNTLHLLAEFYARRIKRLVPAALTTLMGTLVLAALSGNLSVLLANAKNAVSAATFWQNWFLANDSLNYLQQDNLVVATQHFWSLSLEEQFYAMWPILLVVSTLITINIVVLFKKQKISGAILPITLATLLSLAYGVWLTKHSPTVAYYDTFGRVWELMIGGVIAFLPIIKSYDLKLLMPYAGLTLNLYSIFFISGDGFPGWSALLPTVGTAMIIWAGVGRAESRLAFDNLFSWRPIQWTGDISYSIYLWHFPLIIILPILLHYDISGKYGTFFKAGIVALTLILAQLSYRYVEQATQRIRTKTHYVYIIFAIATSLVVAVSIGLKYHTENRIDATLRDVHAAVLDESNTCFGARAILHQVKCGNPYGKINTAYATAGQQDIWFNLIRSNRPCYAFYAGKKGRENVQEYCTFGDQKADRSIALVGDSHAEQYVNTFDSIGLRNHYKIYLLNALPCITNWDIMKQNSLCKDRLDSMLSLLAIIHKSSTESFIVASSLFLRYDDVKAFLNTLKRSTKMKTVLLKDEPRSDEKRINDCYISRTNCVISRARATKETTEIASNLIKNGVVSNEDIINLDNAFCNSTNCFSFIGGAPVYYNTNKADYGVTNSHITASYSLSLSFIVEHELQERRLLK